MRSGPDVVKPALDLALAARIAAIPADVVHAHSHEALVAAVLARARTGVPVVYNPHTLLGEELPTYLPRLRRAGAFAGHAADRLLPRFADAGVGISARAERALRDAGCRRVRRVLPGVDPEDFAGVSPRRLPGGPWVVYAGNPDAYQDLPILFEAVRRVAEARLLIVSAAEWPEVPGATVVRAASWPEARDWIAGADVAALPRTVCAGFPIKLLNYVALGLPVVVAAGSAQGLPGEIVVADGDVGAFAAGIRAALAASRQDPRAARARLAPDGDLARCAWDGRAAEIEGIYAALSSTIR
jgi:hypothetical protein